MNKITYLFGAGASANALPVVKNIPQKLTELINFLSKPQFMQVGKQFNNKNLTDKTAEEYQKEMIDDLKWLKYNADEHASVDTFAKKLYLKQDSNQLNKLKHSLSLFFMFEHKRNKPDIRYDAFFAAILTSLYNLPDNLRIISWNYDLQFEQSFTQYMSGDIAENQVHLNVNEKNSALHSSRQFGIYKLNGSIFIDTFHRRRKLLYAPDFNKQIDKEFISNVIQNYITWKNSSDIDNSLSFAWEENYDRGEFMSNVLQETNDTEILVVIGYSFPFFNREIDRAIIQNMESLKRVYFQAPDADNLKERFQAIRDDIHNGNLIPKFDIEQFFLPNEL